MTKSGVIVSKIPSISKSNYENTFNFLFYTLFLVDFVKLEGDSIVKADNRYEKVEKSKFLGFIKLFPEFGIMKLQVVKHFV